MSLAIYISVFIFIFLLNIIPLIGPPTWTVLSFISITYPIPSIPLFILVALCASTLGRIFLTLSSKYIVRTQFLSKKHIRNMDYLKSKLEKNPKVTFWIFLVDAISPLPSDPLFIAYGLTGLKIRYAIIPFIIGRAFTYTFWLYLVNRIYNSIVIDSSVFSFPSKSVLIVAGLFLFLLYLFVKIDWKILIKSHKLKIVS